jgi:hypothetical protein
VIEVPEFSPEMAERTKFLKGDEFPIESLVIPFDLTASAWVIGPAEDQFDTVFLSFRFERFSDKLFPIIDVDLTGNPSGAECPLYGIPEPGTSIL